MAFASFQLENRLENMQKDSGETARRKTKQTNVYFIDLLKYEATVRGQHSVLEACRAPLLCCKLRSEIARITNSVEKNTHTQKKHCKL